MREIVLDTETTGMDPETGDRIVEVGCVELINHIPTGKSLQLYINPEREVPQEATAVHGLTNAFLANKPVFSQVYSEMMDFIGDATLVIHNAEFDMKFINYQLRDVGAPAIPWSRVIDTLTMARKKYPGSPANLDALCRRFEIDSSERTFHGALLDAELLSEVYLELLGGRQHGLLEGGSTSTGQSTIVTIQVERAYRAARPHAASVEELSLHIELLDQLKNAHWAKKAS